MSVREKVIEKRRLRKDPAYFDEWCTRMHEWYPEGRPAAGRDRVVKKSLKHTYHSSACENDLLACGHTRP